jgi:plastocyanin
MSHSWKISIGRKRSDGKSEFEPTYLVVNKNDQIYWENNDTNPHWPGLMNADGTIDATFFMQNQIPPSGISTVFVPGVEGDFTYSCSLHQGEMGRIQVNRNGGGGIGP